MRKWLWLGIMVLGVGGLCVSQEIQAGKEFPWLVETPQNAKITFFLDLSEKDFLPGIKQMAEAIVGFLTVYAKQSDAKIKAEDIEPGLANIMQDLKRVKVLTFEALDREPGEIFASYANKLGKEWRQVFYQAERGRMNSLYVLGEREGIFAIFASPKDKGSKATLLQTEGFLDIGKIAGLVANILHLLTPTVEQPQKETSPQ